ncbi:MAG: hypothetical protein BGO88_01140 [Flavobacterium sp. 38-13]|uniref:hypothetical protein n=1 Tax=Flavobacterium sp. 38-13 TaxID=1896168 RepID=UPI0009624A88|nr:hypothetical protein [Flavobacterium sp. 38-13]OJX49156.1 MAG: hypothetical protein BGO88_01140 [Flavobacterium sp. 38-13]
MNESLKLRQILNNSKIGLLDKVNFVKTEIKPIDFFKTFNNNRILKQVLNKNLFPQKLDHIKINEPFNFTNNFEAEFQWVATKILFNTEQINQFVTLKEDFEIAILKNEYEKAKNIVEKTISNYGHSLWSIESELHIAEDEIGSSENWQKLSNYLRTIDNPFYEFCINASSKKIENSISFESYVNQVQNDIDIINANILIKDFFVFNNFKLANYNYDFSDLRSVIYISNLFSIFDQYNTIIDIIIFNLNNKEVIYNATFKSFISKLIATGNTDSRVININNYLSQDHFIENKNWVRINEIFETYYEGNFVQALQSSKDFILEYPLEFEVYEIYTKSLINLNKNFESIDIKPVSSILFDIYNFLQFKKEYEKYGKKLLKHALKYSNSILGFQIMEFLSNIDNNKTNLLKYSFYSNTYKITTQKIENNFSEELDQYFNRYNYYSYKKILHGIKNAEYNKFKTKDILLQINAEVTHLYNNKDFIKVINTIKKQKSACISINYYKERFIFFLFNSYLGENNIVEALNLFGTLFFDDETFYLKINFRELYDQTFKEENKFKYVDNINSLILASLYQSEYNLYEILDEFLCSQNYDIQDIINLKDIKQDVIVYLLHKICTIDTIKYFFGRINDAEEFRLNILSHLIKIDEINKKSYQEEVDEINKKISVRNVIKEVNKGRLFVDIDKLKEQLIEKYNDDFNRLLRIVGEKKNNNLVGFNASKPRNWETSLKEQIQDDLNSYNEADFIAFKNIYYEVREQFLFSKEYGLDSSLSTRIRHGALENQIRSVFENLNLVTTKLAGEYIDSEYWNSQNLDFENLQVIQNQIKSFSKSVDELSSALKNNIIQISHEKINNVYAGFNYGTNDEKLYMFYLEFFDKFQSTEETIDLLLNHLSTTTNFIICSDIGNFLKDTVFKEFEKIVQQFISQLPNNLPNEIYLLEKLNQSLTNLQFSLDEISEWFWLETSSSSQLLLLEDVINASIEITQRLYNTIQIDYDLRINEKQMLVYSSLIYVFNILFSNAIIHSGLDETIKIEIDVSVFEEKYVRIDVKNNFSSNNNLNSKNLKEVKENWTDLKNIERSNVEGESGFHKIKRIMIYEAKCITDKFDYEITDNHVNISLFLIYNKT